jgi:hypothetical protein
MIFIGTLTDYYLNNFEEGCLLRIYHCLYTVPHPRFVVFILLRVFARSSSHIEGGEDIIHKSK